MSPTTNMQIFPPGYLWAPGTVALKERGASKLNLFPIPTTHPDDPLNWSSWRKFINYGLVCSYVLWTFVQLDIGYTAWVPMQLELGFTPWFQNTGAALNYAALAVGCFFFIPFVHKYGRRPIYILSNALQFAACVWMATTYTHGDFIGSNILSGLGGAICETVVQITIADVFFVNQHATMNGWYLLITSVGAFLGPVASGYVANAQGWRWMWWWCVIFVGIQLVATVLLYEESKFVPKAQAVLMPVHSDRNSNDSGKGGDTVVASESVREEVSALHNVTESWIDPAITPKSYWQRMAWITPTDAPILRHLYQPFVILVTFPAVTYTALTFGCVLATFAILSTISAIYLPLPPYNFSPAGVGLMNLPPFIGTFIGFFFAGWLNDKSIVWFATRNQGIYEPEHRLWMAVPSALLIPIGMLIYGIGLAHTVPWIVLAVGGCFFGVGFIIVSDIALAYCTDCYQDIVGDALVGVVLSRNIISVAVLFVLEYWIDGMGIQNLHITLACAMLAVLAIPILFLIYGKRLRIWTAKRYEKMAKLQPTHRTF